VSTITAIVNNYRWDPYKEAVADLIIIAFFYLLQVGEYTSPSKPWEKRTIALRDCDVRLWKDGNLLPHSAGLAALLMADSATICIAHTKNGTKGAVVHHDAIGGPICPVATLAQCIANMGPTKCTSAGYIMLQEQALESQTKTLAWGCGGGQHSIAC
jgi:hypothetical protein